MVDARVPEDKHVYGEQPAPVQPETPEPATEPEAVEEEVVVEDHFVEEKSPEHVEVVKAPVPFFNREPVAIAAAVRAVLYVAVLYGFSMTAEQMTAIVIAVESILALVTRQQVTPFVPAGTTPNVDNSANTPQVK